jgi:hypothetical protein
MFFCYSNADCLNHSYCETTPVNENDRLHLHYASWKTDGQRCRQVAQPFLDREAYGAAAGWTEPVFKERISALLLEPSLPLASVIESRRSYAGALRIIRGTSHRSFPKLDKVASLRTVEPFNTKGCGWTTVRWFRQKRSNLQMQITNPNLTGVSTLSLSLYPRVPA